METNKKTFFEDYQNLMKDVKRLEKDESNPFFKSKYVPLKVVLVEAKRVCLENNFVFVQFPGTVLFTDHASSVLKTSLIHSSGEKIEGEIILPVKDEKDPQKLGGALTYMRRYSLTAMLGIEEEDDDGNASAGNKVKSPIQKESHLETKQVPF